MCHVSLKHLATTGIVIGLTVGLGTGCQESTSPFLDISSAEDNGHSTNGYDPHGRGGDVDGAADDAGPKPEICDGWDNDRDGEIDEGTDGAPCTTDGDTQGTSQCINGRLTCRECTPGETRQADCGCDGIKSTDICNDVGRWLKGACDGCNETLEGNDCGFCGFRGADGQCVNGGECKAGDVMYVRCDACPPGDPSCGASCYGEKWTCAGNCQWQKTAACAPRSAECDRDEVFYKPCGMCGYEKVECDGCFWTPGQCKDEGICVPGTSKVVPCFGDDCVDGKYSSITCNASCQWETQNNCSGCIPSPPVDVTSECMAGFDCGEFTTRTQCVGRTQSICGGAGSIVIGEADSWVVASSCRIACTPGASSSRGCTTAAGECGSEPIGCGGDCQWGAGATGPCVALPGACVPGTVTTSTSAPIDCGACGVTYTETTTCTCRANGCGMSCGTSRSNGCPACRPGDQSSVSCTDGSGCGGSAGISCTSSCTWGAPGACVNSRSCTPGSQTYSCPDGCHEYQVITSCDGCGGSSTSSTYGTQCRAECSLGQSKATPCGHCGQSRIDTCNSTCSAWDQGECPPDTCG